MQKEEIVQTLQNFGLGEYESKVYVTLAFLGNAKAAEISSESNVPQSKIYETLESLIGKQLVEVFDGRPKEFRAMAPEFVLKGLVKEREEQLKELKERALTIRGLLRPVKKDDIVEGVWVQKGEKYREVMNRLAELLDKAEEYVYAITRDFSYTSSYRQSILKCKRRGIKIHIIAMGKLSEENYYKVKWYLANGIALRVFDAKVHPRIMVVDGKEMSMRLDQNPLKHKFGFHSIWSQDPSLVSMIDAYMKNMWKQASEVSLSKVAFHA
jgi:sugar-specific transcriptional regulator TrmB